VLRKALVLDDPESFLRKPVAVGTPVPPPFPPQETPAAPDIVTH
jgi:hypothetical protein